MKYFIILLFIPLIYCQNQYYECIINGFEISGCPNKDGCNVNTLNTISYFDLDYRNNLNIDELPDCIDIIRFTRLDISENNIGGPLKCLTMSKIFSSEPILNFSRNQFEGTIPITFIKGGSEFLVSFDLSHNKLEGDLNIEFFNNMRRVRDLRLNNNQFSGTIPDAIFNNMKYLEYLDLSNNQFTGCPKFVNTWSEKFYCDLRGNNFDSDCDFTGLNCLVDNYMSVEFEEEQDECKSNSVCEVKNTLDKKITTEGKLKIMNDIDIKDFVLNDNIPLIESKNNGIISLHDTNIKIRLNDEMIEGIKNGKISSLVQIIEGKNEGRISSIELIHENDKCIPFQTSSQRNFDKNLYVQLLYDNQKCSRNNQGLIVLYVTVSIMGFLIVSSLIIILLSRYNKSLRYKIFPYEKRKEQKDELNV